MSNEWFMGGYPSMGPRLICPGDDMFHELHETLKAKVYAYQNAGERGWPKSVKRELKIEIEEMRAAFIGS